MFVLAISNVCYIIFNFLNLNSAWIHRLDRPKWERPFRAPNWLLGLGTVLAYVNIALLGMGADVWGRGTLLTGAIVIALIVPVFVWRHYVVDKGRFPDAMLEDMHLIPEKGGACRSGRAAVCDGGGRAHGDLRRAPSGGLLTAARVSSCRAGR